MAAVDRAVLIEAANSDFPDYEEAVLYRAARKADADGIVTRNERDFSQADVTVYRPEELRAARWRDDSPRSRLERVREPYLYILVEVESTLVIHVSSRSPLSSGDEYFSRSSSLYPERWGLIGQVTRV